MGGGEPPPAAVAQFGEWVGGAQAAILIIPWASADEEGAYGGWRGTFASFHPARQLEASHDRATFLAQLKEASGVFFTGGDQNRILAVMADKAIPAALHEAYLNGIPFGGTSAGTAIMSRRMFTGFPQLAPGLGLLPEGWLVDTHFAKREREHRMLAALLEVSDESGLGIDEGMALTVRDGHEAKVIGPTFVERFTRVRGEERFIVDILRDGASLELSH